MITNVLINRKHGLKMTGQTKLKLKYFNGRLHKMSLINSPIIVIAVENEKFTIKINRLPV